MIPFYESTIVSPKRKSKKQREIVWFNESFTCPEFEREETKYQRIILLFSTTVATLTLSWLSRLSTNFFRSTHKKGEGRMARVPRIQSIQGQDSCRDSWGCSPSVYSPIITGGGERSLKLCRGGENWRSFSRKTRRGSPYPRSRIHPRISTVELRHFGPPARSTVVIDAIKCFSRLRERNKTTAWLLNARKQKVIALD